MKRPLLVIAAVLLFGAGCSSGPRTASPFPEPGPWPRTGAALVRQAVSQSGAPIMATDAKTGRRFLSELPATFIDGNGNYTTQHDGELVDIQVAIGGTPANDLAQFSAIDGIQTVEEQDLAGWHIATAFDSRDNRWVARATQPDAYDGEHMYHVIECLATSKSDAEFWDGCRTIIEHATVTQGTPGSGSSPTP